jgi:hypothetical protein
MQTFLPYPDFHESAAALDRQRLGKQRIENMTIMKALLADGGYAHHPVTKQWAGYEAALMMYQNAICYEWVNVRGYKDTCLEKTLDVYAPFEVDRAAAISRSFELVSYNTPPWLGNERYHQSHRENLLFKNFEFYAPLFPDDEPSDEKVYPANG